MFPPQPVIRPESCLVFYTYISIRQVSHVESNIKVDLLPLSSALVATRIIPGNRKVCFALSPSDAVEDALILAVVLLPRLPTLPLTTPTCFEIYSQSQAQNRRSDYLQAMIASQIRSSS